MRPIETALPLFFLVVPALAYAQTSQPALSQPQSAPVSAPSSAPISQPTSQETPASTPTNEKKEVTLPPIPPELLPYVPIVDAKVDPNTTKLAGFVTYTLSIERGKEVSVSLPDPLPFGKSLRLKEEKPTQSEPLPDGGVRETREYVFQGFGLDTIEIPALVLTFQAPGGSAQVAGPALSIEVPRTLPPEEDINDKFTPREVEPAEPAWWTWLKSYGLYLLGALAVGVGAFVLYRRYSKKGQAPQQENTPKRPAFEVALESLDTLEKQRPQAKEFHLRLSETLRGYLEDGLSLPAREATSAELLTRLRKEAPAGTEKIDRKTLEEFLAENDLVKFARYVPPLPDLLRSLGVVRGIVEVTKPTQQAEKKEAQ